MPVAGKGPVQMTAEELADEEWGPVKEKGKKAKKGKGKKSKAVDEEEEDQLGNQYKFNFIPRSDRTMTSRDGNVSTRGICCSRSRSYIRRRCRCRPFTRT